MTRGRINHFFALAFALAAFFTLSACGDDEKTKQTGPTGTTVNLGPIPTGVTGPTKGPDIEHTPQASNYEGEEKAVVETLDLMAASVNKDDAKTLCNRIFSEADVKYMNKQGKCYEVIKRLFAYYAGYKIETKEVKVDGDSATAESVMTANQEGEKVSVPNTFVLRKEDGVWKVYIGADKAATEGDDANEL